jgi:trypsin
MEILKVFSLVLLVHFGFGMKLNQESSLKDGKIVGGEVIPLSDAPYQVSLEYRTYFFCGGSIISTTFILSAGHCTYQKNPKLITIRLGTDRLSVGGDSITVKKVTIHPKYNPRTINFDFSLIQLSREITLVPGVKEIIQLPAANDPIADGSETFVSGWGDTQNPSESRYNLRGAKISIINQTTCKKAYSFLTDQMVCAGILTGGVDSCQVRTISSFGYNLLIVLI